MSAKPESSSEAVHEPWVVYILECRDGSLYTGITNDIVRRINQHNEGTGARYTRSRRPVRLRYQELCEDRSAALIRECSLRLLSRKEKEELIRKHQAADPGPESS